MHADLFAKHEGRTVALRIPLPPSVNEYQPTMVRGGRPIRYLSDLAKKFKKNAQAAVLDQLGGWAQPLTGPVRLTVTFFGRNKRLYDIDNRVKPLLDALTENKIWLDDGQVNELHVYRGPIAPPNGYCDVVIEAIEN